MTLDGVAAIRFLIVGEWKNFSAVFKSHMYIYRMLGKLLKERRALRAKATTFNAKGRYSGSIIWAYYGKKIQRFSDLNQRLFK
jgi:hypothetical protein